MSAHQYQLMIDRGWRRSGKYLYKPDIEETCCPPYTIRLDCAKFIPSKSHSKILKKMQKFLLHGKGVRSEEEEDEQMKIIPDAGEEVITQQKRSTDLVLPPLPIPDVDMSGLPLSLLQSEGPENDSVAQGPLDTPLPNPAKQVLVRKAGITNLFDAVEADKENAAHHLKVELYPSVFSSEVYQLYCKYQIAIHRDKPEELNEDKFTQFLVDSPIRASGENGEYGSFHQMYYVDGKLIAVAFLDILPISVSSVYFIYDPDYSSLSLGNYSALREIATTVRLGQMYPSIKYYYLGYYIDSCPKMAYKAKYTPSELLCPYSFNWIPAADAIPLIKQNKRCALEDIKNPGHAYKMPVAYDSLPKIKVTREILALAKILVNKNQVIAATSILSNSDLISRLSTIIERSGTALLDQMLFIAS